MRAERSSHVFSESMTVTARTERISHYSKMKFLNTISFYQNLFVNNVHESWPAGHIVLQPPKLRTAPFQFAVLESAVICIAVLIFEKTWFLKKISTILSSPLRAESCPKQDCYHIIRYQFCSNNKRPMTRTFSSPFAFIPIAIVGFSTGPLEGTWKLHSNTEISWPQHFLKLPDLNNILLQAGKFNGKIFWSSTKVAISAVYVWRKMVWASGAAPFPCRLPSLHVPSYSSPLE
jgi:hypothetical protein